MTEVYYPGHPFPPAARNNQPDSNRNLGYTFPQQYASHQYALPVHQGTPARDDDDRRLHDSGEQTPRVENALRRKTPNGTLNAGYDGTIQELHPQKHQLLGDNTCLQYASAGYHEKQTFSQHQQSQQQAHEQWLAGPAQAGHGAYGLQYAQPQAPLPFMDSVLQQAHIQYHPQQYFGRTIPSVIQPSLQYVGPTASGGQGSGPYGPYWHDGTFEPYRPAAIRDPRFYHQYVQSAQWPQSIHASQPWRNSNVAPGHWHAHPPNPNNSLGQLANFSHLLNGPSTFASSHSGTIPGGTIPAGSRHQPADFSQQSAQFESSGNSLGAQQVRSEFGPLSSKGQQRDQTFAWALQQYRDLLAYIQQTRRQQHHQHRPNHGHPVVHRPAFYPRPPKPSPTGFLVHQETQRSHSGNRDVVGPMAAPSNDVLKQGNETRLVSMLETDATQSSSPSASAWSPSGVHFQDNEYQRRASYDQVLGQQHNRSNAHQLPYQAYADRFHTLRRSSGSIVMPIVAQQPVDDSPPSRAILALSYITRLCQETDWQWTDGMHLGGCLAYGLGDFQKALRWYTKVLEMDPKHLEATSNLAATLLALGRRQEAEHHWSKVLRTAPNHFEAVEHLIGLLCGEHRSRDAIRVIEYVERSLRQTKSGDLLKPDQQSECASSTTSRSPCQSDMSDKISYDYDLDGVVFTTDWRDNPGSSEPGFGSSGYAIPGADNGRILALIHAKGNMLYGLGDNGGAARAFEDAVAIAAGRKFRSIQGLVKHILSVVSSIVQPSHLQSAADTALSKEPVLLTPEQALATAKLCFPGQGELPGLQHVPDGPQGLARKAVISTTSNSLLSLAKIFQDGMSNSSRSIGVTPLACGVRDILALYYLSLSLQPSPSTANNVGILLASVQQIVVPSKPSQKIDIPGVVPGSGIALALQYYNYGLNLDQHHAHLYTNLGSLLKDIGQLDAAINMYERAVKCDGKFDIALANLANAVKDRGRISDAIVYYKRAVDVSPEFAEAVCGLANALNSVCSWQARGGIADEGGKRDRWHVDANGMLLDAKQPGASSSGWLKRVVDIVEKQLIDGERWGCGTLSPALLETLVQQVIILDGSPTDVKEREKSLRQQLNRWTGQTWEGARVTRLVERATKRIGWHWYRDLYVKKRFRTPSSYDRPQLPAGITIPSAPTVLPFHTFTCPMSAKQIRYISQRNGLRISVSTLRSPWLPKQVYPPPQPPAPYLRVGYVSSDFNNHPLAHLMQSVFGLHDTKRVKAYCYATTASDSSVHRQQIQNEAPVFHDASTWSAEKLVGQIVQDGIHILVNLNGYTRGARNEVFAARPAPIQMSFMGFAGTLGAEWCDYLLADETAIPAETLRPWRRNVDVEDQMVDENHGGDQDQWVYGENIIYCRDTFFCCDHRQSAPDAQEKRIDWDEEQKRRWQMRKELFPQITDETIIFGNFNQLYKIDPTTFRTWLRILARLPNAILWLLRFPDLGESHLLATARLWAGAGVASRVIFTDVAPKHLHISRARLCDLVLDTAECNAHTTAADVLWSGTPLLTLPRYKYKMCSRMAASILKGALPIGTQAGKEAAGELIAESEEDYEEKAVALGKGLEYSTGCDGFGRGRLMELRKMLFHARWTSALFDTRRWVRDLEDAYEEAWRRWVAGEGGDIWL